MRKRVIGYDAKILHTPFPFLFGSHAASEIAPTTVVDAAEQQRSGLRAKIDQSFNPLDTLTISRVLRRSRKMLGSSLTRRSYRGVG
jgi:hypothetical protein